MYRFVEIGLISALILFIVGGCSGKRPDGIGIDPSGLKGCPKRPNCVSSEAKDEQHAIESFRLKGDPNVSWPLIQDEIASMPRWVIVTATGNYIHVECKSRIFRFIDDLELYFNSSNGIISIRSASRIGYSDFGANRRRVELLRSELRTKQVIEQWDLVDVQDVWDSVEEIKFYKFLLGGQSEELENQLKS